MCRNENQQKTEQTNQVGVVYVPALIEKKEVSMAEEEKRRADSIEKTNGQEQRENTEQNPVNVESIAGPGMNPGKARVLEQKGGLNPPLRNSIERPNKLYHPKHEKTEGDSEENQRSDVDRRKAPMP